MATQTKTNKRRTVLNNTSTRVCKHISRLMGNNPQSNKIITQIQKWVLESGIEFTVDRLKTLKQFALLIIEKKYNFKTPFLDTERLVWFEQTKHGWPTGPIGELVSSLAQDRSIKNYSKVLSILNVYKGFKLKSPSNKQQRKFVEAIEGEKKLTEYGLQEVLEDLPIRKVASSFSTLFQNSYDRNFKFSFAGLNTSKKALSKFLIPVSIQQETPEYLFSFLEDCTMKGPISSILKDMGVPIIDEEQLKPHHGVGGAISLIQEGGAKARVICMPSSGAQVAFYPLHRTLSVLLRRIKADCTFDQNKGVNWAAEQLSLGRTVYAVDLSSATDNFPLDLQVTVLQCLGYRHLEEFRSFVDLKFVATKSTGMKNHYFKYTKGQPMGLYGSFNLFALTHHVLLKSIEVKLGVFDTYRILGDDIVISNNKVYDQYMLYMEKLHVPISYNKCMTSDNITEFAGKIILPSGALKLVNGTHEKILNPDQFIKCMSASPASYKSILRDIPKKYVSEAMNIAQLPEEFGGVGWNPNGLPLLDRLVMFKNKNALDGPIELIERTIRNQIMQMEAVIRGGKLSTIKAKDGITTSGFRLEGLTPYEELSAYQKYGLTILDFINSQLTKMDDSVIEWVKKQKGIKFSDVRLAKSLILQEAASSELDMPINVFYGAVHERPDIHVKEFTSSAAVKSSWNTKLASIGGTIGRIFDSLKTDEDFAKWETKPNSLSPRWESGMRVVDLDKEIEDTFTANDADNGIICLDNFKTDAIMTKVGQMSPGMKVPLSIGIVDIPASELKETLLIDKSEEGNEQSLSLDTILELLVKQEKERKPLMQMTLDAIAKLTFTVGNEGDTSQNEAKDAYIRK